MGEPQVPDTMSKMLRGWDAALGLIFVHSFNWTAWASNGEEQKTDDAYLRADVR